MHRCYYQQVALLYIPLNKLLRLILFIKIKSYLILKLPENHSFLIKLFFLAKEQIMIIDNYADGFLLDMLTNITVPVSIYTSKASYLNKCEVKSNISIIYTDLFHDRYIIIDKITYTMGTSFNSIGKKRFTISKLEDITPVMLLKNIK